MRSRGSIVVISGGNAANSLVDVFKSVSAGSPISYIIGISDNGGSTSELIRVFGGPGIGDIRSRLIRLVPDDTGDEERLRIKGLLNYRLPPSAEAARHEWNLIVEGTHQNWDGIPSEKKELLRSFFILVGGEITKRTRPTSTFNFQLASLGNLFITGCRIFFGSLESAIFLFRSVCGVPEYAHVIPALNSNFSHHIAAGLTDGTVIAGQNQISHPSEEPASGNHAVQITGNQALPELTAQLKNSSIIPRSPSGPVFGSTTPLNPGYSTPVLYLHDHDEIEDANLPGSLPALRRGNIVFTKEEEAELPARIQRIWYINPYGQEIRPPANPKSLAAIRSAETLVYSIGSLYTSIIPCLILRGMGETIASSCKHKVLILNGSFDRETGPGTTFTALDFVKSIVNACVESQGIVAGETGFEQLTAETEYKRYITHILYLEGYDVPKVDTAKFKELGIESWKVAGKKNEKGKGCLFEMPALGQALDMIRGRKQSPKQRRSTVDSTRMQVLPVIGV
ncbi:uncharacterized protein DFL_004812 [Arthrobotrys flagrans]|uniref:Uncharacterized protein n=1 Tax=Arthrobotrys flagrans TaxID=97331 RepID=A0A437A619_ARTFL|nr:hypothetical protein DFL_004812 [Arthrobotrys flagrans]